MNITPDTSADPQLSREDALAILNTPDESLEELVSFAETFRRKYKGNHVSIHILTNARSGNCSQDCAYCAQSCRSKADIDKYKWVADEKLYEDNDFVNEHHLSRHCIGLSGMKFTDAEIEVLAEKIRKMKADGTHLCCSIGFLTEHQAKVLKDAGLDRINHNLNSSRNYYPNICSTHTFDQRVANIRMLQGLGYEICSGGIIGMGESREDVVDMLMELREIQPEALPINFLLPIPGTPLEHADMSVLSTAYCMKVLCLARLLVPKADIRCAAGREVYFKGEENMLLRVVDSIFASGYLTAGGQGIRDTIQAIEAGRLYLRNRIRLISYTILTNTIHQSQKEDRHDSGKYQHFPLDPHLCNGNHRLYGRSYLYPCTTLHPHWTGADFSHEPRHLSVSLSAKLETRHHQLLSLSADRTGRSSCLLWI